jgi:tetratricopeptide (TPR) repeat protein
VLASLNALRGKWSLAEASFTKAITADPENADFRGRYAVSLLLPTGQLRKAQSVAMEARRLAPANSFPEAILSFVDQALGADEEAVRLADAAISRGGDPRQMQPVYASAAARGGRYAEAADHAIKVLPLALRDGDGAATVRLAYEALADQSKRQAALTALEKLTRDPAWSRADPRSRQFVLYLYAKFGALDELYAEMNRLLVQGDGAFPAIIAIGSMWSPEMLPFRQDARFQGLVEQVGLIDYWSEFGPPDDCTLADRKLSCSRR